ncbi:MAG: MBOAT family protein [Clostridiales bacterium]|nr:MBOAT family protein [Clostridiales bacterium]
MVFSSLTFLLLFLPIFLALYFVVGNIHWRNGVLLIFSLLFYAWGEPVWILAMLFSTAVNYGCGLVIVKTKSSRKKKLVLALGIIISLSSLVYFKYSAFFVNSITTLFSLSFELPTLLLPIGISFYTFQILTYTIDVYRGDAPVQKNPLNLLLYVSCFPQLIAGPIVQYADIASSITDRESSMDDFSQGMRRFVVGLGKKVLIANICGEAVEALTASSGVSVAGAWLMTLLHALQIYFDFSAYSDMAIGIGRMIGFKYKENFNYPYIAHSITEFWRRWHMSLSGFFRKYVYIPLGGNRKGNGRTALNILIVWSLTGLWHGASWNFVLWGAYYGVLLLLEKFVFHKILEKTPKPIRHLITLVAVLFGWAIFYYTDTGSMINQISAMVGIGAELIDATTLTVLKKYSFFPLLAMILSMPILPAIKVQLEKKPWLEKTGNIVGTILLTLVLVLSLLFLVGESYNPFIYFRF